MGGFGTRIMRGTGRILAFVLLATRSAFAAGAPPAADDFAFFHENVMGTSLELRVQADSEAIARRAEVVVLAEIERLAAIFSGYDPQSEFSRWQRSDGTPVAVSAELFEVLEACDRWRIASQGAFDPRVEALSRLWSESSRRGRTPTTDELAEARARMAARAWSLDASKRTARRLSDCPLSLNAIAKGYIVGRACDLAMKSGARGVLLNVGGDLRVCGESPRAIGVVDPNRDSETSEPLTLIAVGDRAVSTSGRSQRGYQIGDRWYSHIIDPRTGFPVSRSIAATVIARNSADSDALATIFNVLSVSESLALARTVEGVECLIVSADGRVDRSEGFGRYETFKPSQDAREKPKTDAAVSLGDEFELVVDFEINHPEAEAGRYRRPYVAIWIEDKDGFPVRNLTLWVSLGGSGPFQWLPDLKRWYLADQARKRVDKTEMVLTMARPTRPPGKYSVVWDGKNDKGQPLSRGEYTLSIDCAREHGTYQGINKKITLDDMPFREELKGNVEIKAASVEYRKRKPAR